MIDLGTLAIYRKRYVIQQAKTWRLKPPLYRVGQSCLASILKDIRSISAKSKADDQGREYRDG